MTALLHRIVVWWALAGGGVLLAIVLATVVNAGGFALDRLARLAGGTVPGLFGYEDFVRLAVSAAALMCFPYCQLKRGHVAVEFLADRLPAAAQRLIDASVSLGLAVSFAFLAYWMALGMAETRADGALSRVLGWPEWPFYLPGVLSLALSALVALQQLLARPGGAPADG